MLRPSGHPGPRRGGPHDLLIAGLLVVVCASLYMRAPVHQMYDSRFITAVSHSLLHDASFAVPDSLAARAQYQLHRVDRRLYHLFPNAPALLNVPVLWFYEQLGWGLYDEAGRFRLATEVGVLRASAAVVTALSVALLYLVARRFLGSGASAGLALAFAFATPLLSTASRPYWSHAWGVFFLSLALWLLLAPARGAGRTALAATALAWAVFCRPTFALAAAALSVLVALDAGRRRRLVVLVGTGLLWAGLFVVYSMSVYGEPAPPYFYTAQAMEKRMSVSRLLDVHPEAMLGTLVSPGRGLFLFTPLFVAILVAVAWRWRRLPSRPLAAIAVVVLVAHWKVVSSFGTWWGGGCFGPRLFADVVPWFLVLAALALAAGPGGRGRLPRATAPVLVGLALAASLVVHVRGATAAETMRWGHLKWRQLVGPAADRAFLDLRMWNWRYPQFVAGWLGPPPLEGVALPGASLEYDAGVDKDPADGWWSGGRRRHLDWDLVPAVEHVVPETGAAGLEGAFLFDGRGGGRTRSFQELASAVTRHDATLEIWVRPDAPLADSQVLFETGGKETGFTLFLDRGRPAMEVREGGASGATVLVAETALDGREFAQLVAVLEMAPAGAWMTLYVDGERAAGPLLADGVADWAGGNASGLGTDDHDPSGAAGDYRGAIGLLRFYRAAFQPEDVAHNFRAVMSPLELRYRRRAA